MRRLRILAEGSEKGSAKRFAMRLNIGETAWNNYETGVAQPSIENALRLVHFFPGLTLDWIYRGTLEGLTFDLVNKLLEQPVDDAQTA